ncbi:MAG: ATP synthase subunit C [Candidatus Hodarchaeales archaeon]|jgi:V/A-type H+-transporting ATPase subunit K
MNPLLKRFLKIQLLVLFGAIAVSFFTIGALALFEDSNTQSTSAVAAADPEAAGFIGLGAGLAVGVAGLGAGIGMGSAGSAAIGAITEKPEVFGRSLIYVVLIEAIAIYGLVIAFLLIQNIA